MLENFKQLINRKNQFNLFLLFILLIFATLIEMIGIGSIPIFAIVIVEPDKVLNNLPEFLNFDFILNMNNKDLALYSAITMFLIFLFKNLYLGFVNFVHGKVFQKIRNEIYNNLFYSYIKCNYEFHITRNSADLIRNITSEISKSVAFITNCMLLIKEFLVVITIFVMLIIIDFKISFLIFSLLGIFSGIFFFLSRRGTKLRGKIIQDYWGKQIKTIGHGLGSIKQTKILNKEKYIFDIFKYNTFIIEKYNFFQGFIVTLPRLFLELMAILVIVIVSITFALSDRSFESFIPLIALITASSVRLIPSFNTISSSTATIRHYLPSFNLIVDELKNMEKINLNVKKPSKQKDNLSFKKSIKVNNLTYSYPNTEKKVIDNVSFEINFKDIVGIAGSSGEGKSTLIDLISGLLKPTSGSIFVDEIDINKEESNWQKQIGYVPQEIYLLDDTIKANIAFGETDKEFNEKNYLEAIKLAQLESFINNLKNKDNTNVGDRGIRLSGGQKQRIGIARSLYFKPNILIFDEPTSSLDIENENKIINDLYNLSNNITIIIISHRLSIFEKCKKIFKVKDGRVFEIENNSN